ncbi:hypothetical protein [Labrys wisconsinensis]|uniref:Uncharacterized protein n=1 Tax=Labrys wisconsinensis TaxID=425677 RepID=A0ABU0JN63_9HYPH|nr:hypothetical protein [Labrys wisconsinensis]MDQ0474838.1 hypothetical protein [Labrys wisconsinensis]
MARSTSSWATLPDGRVVIEIFNERLAFSPSDDGYVSFSRYDDGTYHVMSLAEVIGDADDARAFFDKDRSSRSGITVNLSTNPASNKAPGRPFLGAFDWNAIPRTNPTKLLAFEILSDNPLIEGVRGWLRPHQREQLPPTDRYPLASATSEYGFTSYPISRTFNHLQKEEPIETLYILPGSHRSPPLRGNLAILCRWLGSPWRHCEFTQYSKDMLIRMFWQWPENEFPEGSWQTVDRLSRAIAGHIFIDRGEGDFE